MQAQATHVSVFPQTLDQFMAWEPTDGYKYEWYDGELIRFSGMKKSSILSMMF